MKRSYKLLLLCALAASASAMVLLFVGGEAKEAEAQVGCSSYSAVIPSEYAGDSCAVCVPSGTTYDPRFGICTTNYSCSDPGTHSVCNDSNSGCIEVPNGHNDCTGSCTYYQFEKSYALGCSVPTDCSPWDSEFADFTSYACRNERVCQYGLDAGKTLYSKYGCYMGGIGCLGAGPADECRCDPNTIPDCSGGGVCGGAASCNGQTGGWYCKWDFSNDLSCIAGGQSGTCYNGKCESCDDGNSCTEDSGTYPNCRHDNTPINGNWVGCGASASCTATCGGNCVGEAPACSSGPDLTASSPTPASAITGTSQTFSAVVSNGGDGPTPTSFYNFFQTSTEPNGAGTVTDLPRSLMAALSAGSSANASVSHTFSSAGTYYMRVCADKSNRSDSGLISESNESNNCSTWATVTVTDPTTPIPGPTVTANIWADKNNLDYNDFTTVRWSSINATSCMISPTGWTGLNGSHSTGNLINTTIYTISCTPPASDSVTINVSAPEEETLSVVKAGQGTVTSSPESINCGPGCSSQSAQFVKGSSVTLTAMPAAGRLFTGWGGSCAGIPRTNDSNGDGKPDCTVIMDESKTVNVYFAIDPNYKEF